MAVVLNRNTAWHFQQQLKLWDCPSICLREQIFHFSQDVFEIHFVSKRNTSPILALLRCAWMRNIVFKPSGSLLKTWTFGGQTWFWLHGFDNPWLSVPSFFFFFLPDKRIPAKHATNLRLPVESKKTMFCWSQSARSFLHKAELLSSLRAGLQRSIGLRCDVTTFNYWNDNFGYSFYFGHSRAQRQIMSILHFWGLISLSLFMHLLCIPSR